MEMPALVEVVMSSDSVVAEGGWVGEGDGVVVAVVVGWAVDGAVETGGDLGWVCEGGLVGHLAWSWECRDGCDTHS